MRSPRAFMVASFAGLAVVVALAGWYDRKGALHAAEDHVELTVELCGAGLEWARRKSSCTSKSSCASQD